MEWEAFRAHPNGKFPVAPWAEVRQGVRRRICGREISKRPEKAPDRCFYECFQSLHDHHPMRSDTDTTGQDVEAVGNKGGVKVGEFRHCQEMFEVASQTALFKDIWNIHEIHRKPGMFSIGLEYTFEGGCPGTNMENGCGGEGTM